jgi:hypothetical protein
MLLRHVDADGRSAVELLARLHEASPSGQCTGASLYVLRHRPHWVMEGRRTLDPRHVRAAFADPRGFDVAAQSGVFVRREHEAAQAIAQRIQQAPTACHRWLLTHPQLPRVANLDTLMCALAGLVGGPRRTWWSWLRTRLWARGDLPQPEGIVDEWSPFSTLQRHWDLSLHPRDGYTDTCLFERASTPLLRWLVRQPGWLQAAAIPPRALMERVNTARPPNDDWMVPLCLARPAVLWEDCTDGDGPTPVPMMGLATDAGRGDGMDRFSALVLCLPHSLAHRPAHGAWPLDARAAAEQATNVREWAAAAHATNAREWAAALQHTHGFAVPLTGGGLVWAVAAALGAGAWHRRRSAVVGAVVRGGEP